ncbi:precorrin-8X methylmutase, partial [Paenibacillus validus]|nr:precorrin-8X methylmutase [Paenibacillus validus]
DGAIYAIGNAPTALLELIRLVKEGEARPGLIIGVPVGFVSAAESKEELLKLDVPFITNIGRKGGSPVAVATVNALSLLAERQG